MISQFNYQTQYSTIHTSNIRHNNHAYNISHKSNTNAIFHNWSQQSLRHIKHAQCIYHICISNSHFINKHQCIIISIMTYAMHRDRHTTLCMRYQLEFISPPRNSWNHRLLLSVTPRRANDVPRCSHLARLRLTTFRDRYHLARLRLTIRPLKPTRAYGRL